MKTGHFNIGLLAFTDLYKHTFTQTNFPELMKDDAIRASILDITGFKYEKILEDIGYEPDDLNLIMVPLYFEYPDAFNRVLPGVFAKYQQIFSN